jgi:hypothetical protein
LLTLRRLGATTRSRTIVTAMRCLADPSPGLWAAIATGASTASIPAIATVTAIPTITIKAWFFLIL